MKTVLENARREPALRVRDVAKTFRGATALEGVSLELRRGERLALLGPYGAGKTTLVRCISSRAVPDSGTIEMFGEVLPPRGRREKLGFVPREIAIYPDLTTRENLDAFGRFHGLSGSDAGKWARSRSTPGRSTAAPRCSGASSRWAPSGPSSPCSSPSPSPSLAPPLGERLRR